MIATPLRRASLVPLLLPLLLGCASAGPAGSTTEPVAARVEVLPEAPGGASSASLLGASPDAAPREVNLAFELVVDGSGSMKGMPWEMTKSAAIEAIRLLPDDDLFGMIVFDSSPKRTSELRPGRDRAEIELVIGGLEPGGGTELLSALEMAHKDLRKVEARQKRMLLVTDGSVPTEGIDEIVNRMKSDGIAISTVALGTSADEALMRRIATATGGRIYLVPNPALLPRIVTQEVAKVSAR